jgi:hypothetical protein
MSTDCIQDTGSAGKRCVQTEPWVIAPLVDAGVPLDQVRELVFRLAFDDVLRQGSGTVGDLGEIVADQPPAVRTAWAQVIGRMLAVEFA